jgi:CHAT domain-containing protein
MSVQQQGQERRLENDVVSFKARIKREKERRRPDPKKLADFDARLQKAIADYRAFETRLYAVNPQLRALRGESLPLKIDEAAGLLPSPQTALLEFVVTDSRVYLLAITREESASRMKRQDGTPSPAAQRRVLVPRPAAQNIRLMAYALGASRSELARRIIKLREATVARDLGAAQLARDLYDLLLKPADEQLKSKAVWVIVPDAVLWQLPFQALQSADGRYLIEDHAISYAPSLTALDEIRKQAGVPRSSLASAPSIFAVGNPLIGRQTAERIKLMSDLKIEPSAGAESEVKEIEQVYGAARSKTYTGAQASEEAVKEQAGRSNVAHFAAPALLNEASPMYSYVALAHSEESGAEDGLLEAWEMMKQGPASHLVVLSASETQSRSVTGDAMTALSWSLFVAGCPASVFGQWRTDAASAAEFMREFHRNLKWKSSSAKQPPARQSLNIDIAIAEALRQAGLKLIRSSQYQHPFYWASFRLMGR